MKTAACFVAAVLLHALLLFGFKMGTPAHPLVMNDESSPVDVSLVEAAPEAPAAIHAAASEPVSTLKPEEQATPEPTPDMSTPPPVPQPTPEQETMPEAESTLPPEPPKPAPRHPEQRHSRISMPHSAGGSAAALAARNAAAAGVGHGAASGPLVSSGALP